MNTSRTSSPPVTVVCCVSGYFITLFVCFYPLQYVLQTFDFPHAAEIQKLAAKIVSHISSFHFSAIFNKVSFR